MTQQGSKEVWPPVPRTQHGNGIGIPKEASLEPIQWRTDT